jgi:uncharacterized DUF497 family protein
VASRWNDGKNEINFQKHGISFEEADSVFDDPLIIVIDDPEHSYEENRHVAIGATCERRLVVVSYTIRNDEPWLISARTAEARERKKYMAADSINDGGDIRPYYDFSGGVRGKHFRGRDRTMVSYGIDAEIAAYFPTSEDVNKALRMLIEEGRVPVRVANE